MTILTTKRTNTKFGWHSGTLYCKDINVMNDFKIFGSLTFADAITDILSVSGLLKIGTSGTPLVLTAGTPTFTLYTTCAGTSGSTSAEPFYVKSTLTGAGQVGGRSRFHTYSNVASGGWINALKAYMDFGASGSSSGLASALCAEINLPASGTSSGSYCALEGEILCPTGWTSTAPTAFFYLNASGNTVANFDTYGYLFEIGTGITPAAGKFVSADSQTIKCKIEANTRYVVLSQSENGLGIGVSGTAVSFSQGSPLINLYSTCSSTNGSNSVESMYVETTMTGAAGVGGRARFKLATNVALGSWSNALKAHVAYGASGRTTGMGSALCAEIELSAGTTSGTYAPLESEVVVGASGSLGTATSFLYMNCDTTGEATFNAGAFLFELGSNVNAGSGSLWDTTADLTNPQIDGSLKIKIDGATKYIPVMDNANGS